MARKIITFVKYAVLIVIIAVINLPVISVIGTSVKTRQDIMTNNALFSRSFSLENYAYVLENTPYFTQLWNSFLISVSVTLFSAMTASMAGYVISRYRRKLPFLNTYSSALLLLQMFPTIFILIPLFIMLLRYGIANTRVSVILMYATFALPFSIWTLRAYFDGIPMELDEAGVIDGCSRFQCFARLVLPVSTPGVMSVAVFNFLYCWNEYMLASIFLKDDHLRTLPVGLRNLILQYMNSTQWGALMASSTMTIIPVIIFLVFMQKYVVQGLTAGAVKG